MSTVRHQAVGATAGRRRPVPAAGKVSRMNLGLGVAVAASALAVAAWSLIAVIGDRAIDRSHLVGLGLVQVLACVLIGYAAVRLSHGAHPRQYATFIGYLVAFFLVVPLATLLAKLEPTRWGSVIVMVAGLVMAILVLRLDQVWTGVG
jgi:peptidoglycan/LPS O-acetylase OafA/YrhL